MWPSRSRANLKKRQGVAVIQKRTPKRKVEKEKRERGPRGWEEGQHKKKWEKDHIRYVYRNNQIKNKTEEGGRRT